MKKKVVDETPNVELNSLEIKTKKDPKKRKLLPIFLGIGLALAIALFCYLFIDKIIAIFDKYGIIDNKKEKVEEISDADAQNALHFYKTSYDDTILWVYNNEEVIEVQNDNDFDIYPDFGEIGKYNCKSSDCEGDYINDNNIFIKDDGNYLYDYVTKTKQSLTVTDINYDRVDEAVYNDKLYGLFFVINDSNKKTYYSLGNKKSYEFTAVYNYYENYGTYYIAKEEGYFAFDITDNSFIEMPFSEDDYDDFNPVFYKEKLYGYSLHKKGHSGTDETAYAFYSVKDKKITIASMAGVEYAGVEVLNNHIISDNKLYNFSTGELLHDFSAYFGVNEEFEGIEEGFTTRALGNAKGIYYFINTDVLDGFFGYLLDKNFNALFDSKTYLRKDVGVTNDGNLIVRNEDENSLATTFSIYDANGILISNSKTYQEVLGVYENYIAIIDTDNYLKLINSDGSLVAKFIKWTADMVFRPMSSGYWSEYDRIYLEVQDNSISAVSEDQGFGYDYYYDIENKTTGKIATYTGW